MIFNLSTSLLFLATLAAALPEPVRLETRQTRLRNRAPVAVNKLYEHSPSVHINNDGWGETSKVGAGLTAVNTLIAFQTTAADAGKQCNIRFAKPNILVGTPAFQIWSFIPTTGAMYNDKTATWGARTGRRATTAPLKTHTYRAGGGDLVHSIPCPTNGGVLNYELGPAPGSTNTNLQWDTRRGEGLYLEVATPLPVPMKDQAQMFSARPSSGSGSIQFGEVSQTAQGAITTTLIAFIMPTSPNNQNRMCRLRFSNPTANTGAKKFVVWEFTPAAGRVFFRSDTASWSNKGGVRGKQLATHSVVNKNPATVYQFPCPAPGKGLNYELVSTGVGKIAWNVAASPAGGLTLEIL